MRPHPKLTAAFLLAWMIVAGFSAADWQTGRELFDQGRYSEAAPHFEEQVRTNPNWSAGYLMLGRCQVALERYDEAVENLRTAADLGPDDATNIVTLSRALMTVDRPTEAREALDGLDPGTLDADWQAEVVRMQARCLLDETRAAEAVRLVEAQLARDPDRASLHLALAAAHRATGDQAATFDDLFRAYSLDPSDRKTGRAAVAAGLELADQASDRALSANYSDRALGIAVELAESAADLRHALLAGEVAYETSHSQVAAEWFGSAVKLEPKDPEANFGLGLAMVSLDRDDEAIVHLRIALATESDPKTLRRIRGQLGNLLACRLELTEAARHHRAAGNPDRADQIDEIAGGFATALERLNTLRGSVAEFAEMEVDLEELGDSDGVEAVAGRRAVMENEIAEIEANLSEVRTALCR